MGYEVTGFARSLTILIYKRAYGSVVSGYPKIYDGKTNIDFLAYYSPLYSSISDDEMAKMSLVDFNARLNDFKAWLETVEYELDFDTASIIEDARIASDDCTTTTTSTSTSSSTTTTTTTTELPCEGCSGVLTVGDVSSMFEGEAMGYFDGVGGSVSPYPIIIPEGEIAVVVYSEGNIKVGTSEGYSISVTEIIINGISYEITGGRSDTVDNPFVIGNSYDICINYITCPPKCDYGLLYNFFAVDTGKLAPTGWHVPSDVEWTTLSTYLGGEEIAGGKLKSTGLCDWIAPNEGATNESGFSGLPGGSRIYGGDFIDIGSYGYWWSSTEYPTLYAWNLFLTYNYADVYQGNDFKDYGFSVRCLRDTYEGWENDVPVVDYDGNEYDVVEIGTQLWLVQNLKVTHYNDGEAIPNVEDDTTWAELTTGALCAYDNDWETYACVDKPTTTTTTTVEPTTTTTTTEEPTTTTTTTTTIESYDFCVEYGALYNWYAATDERNIAASGWHLPIGTYYNINDCYTLANFLEPGCDWNINTVGNLVKESGTEFWEFDSGSTNSTGFNARGAGIRSEVTGAFTSKLAYMEFWTESQYWNSGSTAPVCILYSMYSRFSVPGSGTNVEDKKRGISIRLIRDSTTLSHGQSGTYTGNDGKVYRTICIGTQEWLADNLAETKYRNGDLISNHGETYTDKYTDAEWAALTTEAMCYYEDTFSNVGVYEACPTTTTTTAEPTTTTTTTSP